jgi:hypothetical protein
MVTANTRYKRKPFVKRVGRWNTCTCVGDCPAAGLSAISVCTIGPLGRWKFYLSGFRIGGEEAEESVALGDDVGSAHSGYPF